MDENKYLIYGFDSSWDKLRNIRHEVKDFVDVVNNKDLSEAAMITASELCENAIKFGTNISNTENLRLSCEIEDNVIRIIVTCGIANDKNLDDLIRHINKINKEDPSKLYTQRLMDSLNAKNPDGTKFGLYRIAYESQFKISYKITDNTLEINEERNI